MSERAIGRRSRAVSWLLAGLGVVLVVVGGVLIWHPADGAGSAGESPASAAGTSVAESTQASSGPTSSPPEPPRAHWRPGAPRRVVIGSLGVHAPVVPVQAPGRVLIPPSDPQVLGWWAAGAEPGAARGSALIVGHTVHTGGGALDHLGDLRPGARIAVDTDHQHQAYVVRRVHVFSKGTIARHAAELFSQRVAGRLVVLTCTDWTGTVYLSNVVVIAVPVRA